MSRNNTSTLCITLFLTLVIGCVSTGDKTPADRTGSVKDIEQGYHNALYKQLLTRSATAKSPENLISEAGKIASKYLLPYSNTLHTEAQKYLNNLDKLENINISDYESLFSKTEVIKISKMIQDGMLQYSENHHMIATGLWNPIRAAKTYRNVVLSRSFGAQELGYRIMLENLAPPKVLLSKADTNHPEIAMVTGPEITFILLEYRQDQGAYLLKGFRQLRQKH